MSQRKDNIKKKALHTILGGAVICEISEPEIYRYLHEEGGLEEVDEFISDLGCKMTIIGGNKGLFLAWSDGSVEAERAIRTSAKDVQNEADRLIQFTGFMLDVDDSSGHLSMGDLVRAAAIVKSIDHNAALRDGLATLASVMRVNATTDHGRISDVLRKIKDMGYLKLINQDREEYLVTGKIDQINDIIIHYHVHIGALRDIPAENNGQESLF